MAFPFAQCKESSCISVQPNYEWVMRELIDGIPAIAGKSNLGIDVILARITATSKFFPASIGMPRMNS